MKIPQVELKLFTFNPSMGCSKGGTFPTHRLHLWLFTFNPKRVAAKGHISHPQVAPVAIHIQPEKGWHFDKVSTKSVIVRISLT
jgi:hypothetical protein